MTHILVAGGAGYIGSHVCKALAAAGMVPVVLDDFSAGHRAFVRFGPCVEACVSNEAAVAAAVREYHIAAVIDLAGSIEVAESVRDPLKYYENNVARRIPFLRALMAAGVEALVFSSTAAVYGEPQAVPIAEDHPLSPTNPYGATKRMVEQMLADAGRAHGLRAMALRYFNAAGASPDGEIGEAHEPETHLIPRACLASLGAIPPLEIFGNDYPTPDGTAIRDYIHVMDLARAHVQAVVALLSGAGSACYNLGTGQGRSIGAVLATFARLGITVPHRFAPRRVGDPSQLLADSQAAQAALGWKPVVSDLETIVSSAYAWHKGRVNVIASEATQSRPGSR